MTTGFNSHGGKGSRIVSAVLSPAVQLLLRSQVSQVKELSVEISGSDRQILSGVIPKVAIAAKGAVYQGLHLTNISLSGTGIRINLGQVIKGKPLQLLEPIPVIGVLKLKEADFNISLSAPLLSNALHDFLLPLLPIEIADIHQKLNFPNPQIKIEPGKIILKAETLLKNGQKNYFLLRTGLSLASCNELLFEQPELEISHELNHRNLDSFKLDLGSEVTLEELILNPGELICQGEIRVLP
ncbi:hypothetical protein BCD67_16600 [Oscillatoriales cyanobacterium USR001]|nr:hypothetical protein BCD67_16600 [Oscillatoriales cyanobacterium USR001]